MEMKTLSDLYMDELKDLYNAENQLIKALPKMAKKAADPQLKNAFNEHLQQTRGHAERLEKIFEKIGASPRGKKCLGMQGIIEESKEFMDEEASPDVMDAGLIAQAQRVEHYEIAGYGTAVTYARTLGDPQAANLLQQTLDEEGLTDKKLTQLAESTINVQAAQPA